MGVSAKKFFSKQEQEDIKQAILNAELDTSGEIRVHIENVCKGEVLDRAAYVFKWLKMDQTALRNGVLIYLAVKSRKFAIIGDAGINKSVPANFWDSTKHEMLNYFRNEDFVEGLIFGITQAGLHLKKYFPHKKDDINELPDDISFGNK
jgi:uncharacterized membrane protein